MPAAPVTSSRPPWVGLAVALGLVAAAMALPAATAWDVHVRSFPPLHAQWHPRLGPGTAPALLIAAIGVWGAPRLAGRLRWHWLLVSAWSVGVVWMLALALVDGRDGIAQILQTPYEYLQTARTTTDLHHTLQEYVARIPFTAAPHNWPVHIAGHPAGALTFFVVLVRLGLGSGLAAGLVVTVVAATAAPATLVTLRALGAETAARRAAPFLVLGPAAIWQCVSADGMFAAVTAWGLAGLAIATTADRATVRWCASVGSGLLLGYGVMLSYGLPLMGILAASVLWLGRSWRPLLPAAAAAMCVVGTYAAFGFNWFEALHVLHGRYWGGVARHRPPEYWTWANLAALVCSAGPLVAAGLAAAWSRRREGADPAVRVVLGLTGAAVLAVLAADASQMSRAEVERIWLPFVPWLLISCALLPERWRHGGLVLQVVVALLLEHLLATGW